MARRKAPLVNSCGPCAVNQARRTLYWKRSLAKVNAFPTRCCVQWRWGEPGGLSLEMLTQFVGDSLSEVTSPAMRQDVASIFQRVDLHKVGQGTASNSAEACSSRVIRCSPAADRARVPERQ